MLHKQYIAMDAPDALLRICMSDFSKAFDRIDLNILLEKLYGMGIQPVLSNWIANFLTGREQRSRVGNHLSNWKKTSAGVPQGTKLGPLLFLIMVNDLTVSDDTVKLVDDTTIWEIILKDQVSMSILLLQNTECPDWVSRINMKLNPNKAKEIRVCFSSFDTAALPPTSVVPHAKLLGVIISEDLK